MEVLLQALPSITSAIVIGFLAWVFPKFRDLFKSFREFKDEHEELLNFKETQVQSNEELETKLLNAIEKRNHEMAEALSTYRQKNSREFKQFKDKTEKTLQSLVDSQRTQIKANIVDMYQVAKKRNYITPLELDIMNRLGEAYFSLDGNTYIETIVKRSNTELPIHGEEIPEYVEHKGRKDNR